MSSSPATPGLTKAQQEKVNKAVHSASLIMLEAFHETKEANYVAGSFTDGDDQPWEIRFGRKGVAFPPAIAPTASQPLPLTLTGSRWVYDAATPELKEQVNALFATIGMAIPSDNYGPRYRYVMWNGDKVDALYSDWTKPRWGMTQITYEQLEQLVREYASPVPATTATPAPAAPQVAGVAREEALLTKAAELLHCHLSNGTPDHVPILEWLNDYDRATLAATPAAPEAAPLGGSRWAPEAEERQRPGIRVRKGLYPNSDYQSGWATQRVVWNGKAWVHADFVQTVEVAVKYVLVEAEVPEFPAPPTAPAHAAQ